MTTEEKLERARAAKVRYREERLAQEREAAQRALLDATRKREALFAEYGALKDHGTVEAVRLQEQILTVNSQIRNLERGV